MTVPFPQRILHVGLAGLGNVGAGVYKNLEKNRDLILQRTGADIRVRRVVVRDAARARDVAVPAEMLGTDWRALVADPEIQVIVELIGGTGTAYELVCAALRAKKIVVTGNKALLAERG
ncbi:MAG TPA: homoserine dehydrogenase, partial [Verrucomicrobiales bacterium]|nr:homoserine dehydrogenase [Verrucomicrobiales bacterium]